MRLREHEMPLDPEVERELDALDRALAGGSVDPDLEELAQLALELRSERPELSAEAEASLDELAASGFPPRRTDRVGRASREGRGRFAGAATQRATSSGPRLQRHRRVRDRNRRRRLAERASSAARAAARPPGCLQGPRRRHRRRPDPSADEAPPAGSAVRPEQDGNFTARVRLDLPGPRFGATRPVREPQGRPGRRPRPLHPAGRLPRRRRRRARRGPRPSRLRAQLARLGRRSRRQGRRARSRQLRSADSRRGALGGDGRPLRPRSRGFPLRRLTRHHEELRLDPAADRRR